MTETKALTDTGLTRSKVASAERMCAPARTERLIVNALTVDVEDYYHVSGFESKIPRAAWDSFESRVVPSTERVLSCLERAGVTATFFILGWVARKHPALVRRIDSAGHEIGCHSFWHRLVYQQTTDEFREDLERNRDAVEDTIGKRVRCYRAPSFSITKQSLWALDVLIEEGFTIDSSIFPTHHHRYGIIGAETVPHTIACRGGSIIEFPLPVWRGLGYPLPVGGGGYFRLYPYWFTRHALRAINGDARPFCVYVHPWEFDPEQPRLSGRWWQRFRHYVNIRRTETRFMRILKDFTFGTLSQAVHCYRQSERDDLYRLPQ